MPQEVSLKLAVVSLGKVTMTFDKTGNPIMQVSVECPASPSDIARLVNLQRQKVPLSCTFASTQAQFDLHIEQVKVEPGELVQVGA